MDTDLPEEVLREQALLLLAMPKRHPITGRDTGGNLTVGDVAGLFRVDVEEVRRLLDGANYPLEAARRLIAGWRQGGYHGSLYEHISEDLDAALRDRSPGNPIWALVLDEARLLRTLRPKHIVTGEDTDDVLTRDELVELVGPQLRDAVDAIWDEAVDTSGDAGDQAGTAALIDDGVDTGLPEGLLLRQLAQRWGWASSSSPLLTAFGRHVTTRVGTAPHINFRDPVDEVLNEQTMLLLQKTKRHRITGRDTGHNLTVTNVAYLFGAQPEEVQRFLDRRTYPVQKATQLLQEWLQHRQQPFGRKVPLHEYLKHDLGAFLGDRSTGNPIWVMIVEQAKWLRSQRLRHVVTGNFTDTPVTLGTLRMLLGRGLRTIVDRYRDQLTARPFVPPAVSNRGQPGGSLAVAVQLHARLWALGSYQEPLIPYLHRHVPGGIGATTVRTLTCLRRYARWCVSRRCGCCDPTCSMCSPGNRTARKLDYETVAEFLGVTDLQWLADLVASEQPSGLATAGLLTAPVTGIR